ncbi:hypothetical protein T03_9493 [Trichinella britovi]|uniref:Uncharacterized protein n=1 Tax=Trichinella britovi TaxID=45882 RepID=A0A0V1D5S0_TRIBR|nr:hypothetical protein T03_9493 [Trichinella britovi]
MQNKGELCVQAQTNGTTSISDTSALLHGNVSSNAAPLISANNLPLRKMVLYDENNLNCRQPMLIHRKSTILMALLLHHLGRDAVRSTATTSGTVF